MVWLKKSAAAAVLMGFLIIVTLENPIKNGMFVLTVSKAHGGLSCLFCKVARWRAKFGISEDESPQTTSAPEVHPLLFVTWPFFAIQPCVTLTDNCAML